MNDDSRNDDGVEKYTSEDSSLPVALGGLKAKYIVYIILGVAAIVSLTVFWMMDETKKTIVASVPEIESITIVSRLEGEDLATDEHKLIDDGRGLMLYLVAYGYDKTRDQWFYYTDTPPRYDLPRLRINGEDIDPGRVKRFDFFDTLSLVYWYKWELSPNYAFDYTLPYFKQAYRTRARNHQMGTKWWALADVRNDLIRANYEYSGTVHYTAAVQVFPKDDPNTVYADLRTAGFDPETFGRYPESYHRVTRIPVYREGLNATYRAYFNLFARQDVENPMELTRDFTGGNSKSILVGAMQLLGIDVAYNDTDFLEHHARLIFSNVNMDEFEFFRPGGEEADVIPYGENGVQLGDIIVVGDRYMVLAKNNTENEPPSGALTGDDLVLDAYNSMVRLRDLSRVAIDMELQPMQIWRLEKGTPSRVTRMAD